MKKSILAVAGLATIASVAAPVAGVFAADTNDTTFTDTITVTLAGSCSFTSDGAYAESPTINGITPATVNVQNGHLYNTAGGTGATAESTWTGSYYVYCNDNGGWHVDAIGAADASKAGAVNAMAPSKLASSDAIASGTATEGKTANWAFKLAKGADAAESVVVETGYDSYTTVPSSATAVVTSNAPTTAANKGGFTTAYQVYIGTDTKADTYTGKVTYTLGHPKSQS